MRVKRVDFKQECSSEVPVAVTQPKGRYLMVYGIHVFSVTRSATRTPLSPILQFLERIERICIRPLPRLVEDEDNIGWYCACEGPCEHPECQR